MKALGGITGVTYEDRFTNKAVIKMAGPFDLTKLQVQSRLHRYGQVKQRENNSR